MHLLHKNCVFSDRSYIHTHTLMCIFISQHSIKSGSAYPFCVRVSVYLLALFHFFDHRLVQQPNHIFSIHNPDFSSTFQNRELFSLSMYPQAKLSCGLFTSIDFVSTFDPSDFRFQFYFHRAHIQPHQVFASWKQKLPILCHFWHTYLKVEITKMEVLNGRIAHKLSRLLSISFFHHFSNDFFEVKKKHVLLLILKDCTILSAIINDVAFVSFKLRVLVYSFFFILVGIQQKCSEIPVTYDEIMNWFLFFRLI